MQEFIADRMNLIDASGIRKVFDLAASLKDPVNMSIGQPDFDVPVPIKEAMIEAVQKGYNSYSPTQGIPQLIEALKKDLGKKRGTEPEDLFPKIRDAMTELIGTTQTDNRFGDARKKLREYSEAGGTPDQVREAWKIFRRNPKAHLDGKGKKNPLVWFCVNISEILTGAKLEGEHSEDCEALN